MCAAPAARSSALVGWFVVAAFASGGGGGGGSGSGFDAAAFVWDNNVDSTSAGAASP